MRVFGNVVQLMSRVSVFDILSNQFPISGSYGLATVFLVELPIQEVMLPLFPFPVRVGSIDNPSIASSRQFVSSPNNSTKVGIISQPAAIKSLIEPASIVPRPIGDIRHAHTALVQKLVSILSVVPLC